MTDTCWLPASLMQTGVALLGIYAVIYILTVTKPNIKEKAFALHAMFMMVFCISLVSISLNAIWLHNLLDNPLVDLNLFHTFSLPKVLSFFSIPRLAMFFFFSEIIAIFCYTSTMIDIFREKKEYFAGALLIPNIYILLFLGIFFVRELIIHDYAIAFYFLFLTSIPSISVLVYPGLSFKVFNPYCKNLMKKESSLICHRCMGIYCGLFFSLLSGLVFLFFIPDIREIDLPTKSVMIIISGIVFGLNAIQGVLRRGKYTKLNFFTCDRSTSILGFLFGLFAGILGFLFGTSIAVSPI